MPRSRSSEQERMDRAGEIEPGRRPPKRWRDDHPLLLERYADRKARLAAERAEARALLTDIEREVREVQRQARADAATGRRIAWAQETPSGFGDRADAR